MKIAVLGTSTSKFGELWQVSPRDLARQAMNEAIEASGIETAQIDALFVGNMLSGILGAQENLASLFADEADLKVPSFRMEAACASGGMALHNAINGLKAGVYKTALILGVEKMTDQGQEEVISALMAAGSEEERVSGSTFTALYALIAQAYMEKYGISEEDLASISVKNHYHGTLNPKAQFQSEISIEDVMRSAKIADPLKLLDCSPISDGAAAIVITTDEKVMKKHKKPVFLVSSQTATDALSLTDRASLVSLSAVTAASSRAYKEAGIKPKDIDVAEIHDCFSIAEAIAMEDLGFSKRGEGARDTAKGLRTLGKGNIIVNPSGGLKACGHPVGATGIKQIGEIAAHLRGEADERQVKGAKIGLTHNVGGTGAVAAIHILRV